MRLEDALFNWLQIQIVWDARPSDRSAKDTVLFFEQILRENHQVTNLTKKKEGAFYRIDYERNGQPESVTFPCFAAEKLLQDIINEPKYNQSFD